MSRVRSPQALASSGRTVGPRRKQGQGLQVRVALFWAGDCALSHHPSALRARDRPQVATCMPPEAAPASASLHAKEGFGGEAPTQSVPMSVLQRIWLSRVLESLKLMVPLERDFTTTGKHHFTDLQILG